MTDNDSSVAANCAPWPFAFATLPEMLRLHDYACVEAPAELSRETMRMTATWLRRREDGVAASLQAAEAVWDCKDPRSVAAVYGAWWSNMMTLALADITDASVEAARLLQRGHHTMTTFATRAAEIIAPNK